MTTEVAAHPHIVCDGLVRIFKRTEVEVVALQGLDLRVDKGELVAIVGASGSGKTTLLNILSGLDTPSAGYAEVAGAKLVGMSRRERRTYRLHTCGFVWQQASQNLMPFLDAQSNVEMPQWLSRSSSRRRSARAVELLEILGLADQRRQRPAELSGGQQQRLAIAVSLANQPEVLFCDEPTGELDSATAEEVFAAMRHVNAELGTTIVIVTHDPGVSTQVTRTIAIRDGRTSTETLRSFGAEHDSGVMAQEYAVLDRVGRLQLPQDYMDALQLDRRVRLELEPDHIGVWPPEVSHPGAADEEDAS
ncbi:MAG: ABC transporter ATP-binding protein [Nocardioidaceae bacterium]